MNKTKILTISVIALVILNLGMIVFFMVIKPKENKERLEGPRKMIVKKLHFDDKQKEQFEALVEIHKKDIDGIEQDIKQSKENLFAQLSETEVNQKVKDSLVNALGENQKKIENAHFEHFLKVKEICNTPEQQEDFKALTKELGKIFSRRRMQLKEAGKKTK